MERVNTQVGLVWKAGMVGEPEALRLVRKAEREGSDLSYVRTARGEKDGEG
jgi:hypothetical protein